MKGLADSTQRTYRSAQKRFLSFCKAGNFRAVPAAEEVLCRYVSRLAGEGLKHRTIKAYLAGIRFLHVAEGADDPFQPSLLRLHYILRGVKRCEAERGAERRPRLPVTPGILRQLRRIWERESTQPNRTVLWAACCLGYFGFLRMGEMTVPTQDGYDPKVHLNCDDVHVDNAEAPKVLRVSIKQSKTDPFRKGIDIFVGKTFSDLCPVSALLSYLVERGTAKGPLFQLSDGTFLTRQRLVEEIRQALNKAGIDSRAYCGHSLRIGAATTAAVNGMEDALIKTLGRWRSLAYLEYVRIPRNQLAQYSQMLCQ